MTIEVLALIVPWPSRIEPRLIERCEMIRKQSRMGLPTMRDAKTAAIARRVLGYPGSRCGTQGKAFFSWACQIGISVL
jgi:hypothetical protein